MQTVLSTADVEKLVVDRARAMHDGVSLADVAVHEDPGASGPGLLMIRVAADRSTDRRGWIEWRLRLTQAIRDELIEQGDERYPIIEVFSLEEWLQRND